MFSMHTAPKELNNVTIIVSFSRVGELGNLMIFCPHENERPAFSKSSALKGVFEKLRSGE